MRTHNEADRQSHESNVMNNIITFNGQGLSGKSTQSRLLAKSNKEKYKHFHSYTLRREFREEIYKHLGRKGTCIKYPDSDAADQTLYQVEVLGIPTLAWLTAYFHKEIKQQQENYTIVLDHYIADFYVDVLEHCEPEKFQSFVKNHLGIPHFKQGTHFYLDLDYKTYEDRWNMDTKTKREYKVNEEDFEVRRERYQELCNLKYLKCINTIGVSKEEVAEEIRKIISVNTI